MRHKITHAVHRFEEMIFTFPKIILGTILAITVFFAMHIPALKIHTEFADLLPQNHPYIKLHNEISGIFGGASQIIVSVEVENGTIFTNETLATIYKLTQDVDSLPGVNHNLVSSLAHRTSRKIWLAEDGGMESKAYYNPQGPKLSAAELDQLAKDVSANSQVYGLLVSPDLKAALIKAQLNEGGSLDYGKTFEQLQKVRAEAAGDV